jgi:uncharacterized delta-60 repeat protein
MKTITLVSAALLFAPMLFAQNALDTTFDPGTGANSYVESMAVQPDDKILVCGRFTEFNGVPRNFIARLYSNGSIDPSFDVSGTSGPNQNVRSMALQADGKIVIGGYFTSVSGKSRNLVARLNPDGSLDTTFDPGTGCKGLLGKAIDGNTNSFVFAVAVQADQKIIIGGNFTNYNGVARNGIARLNSDGSLDTTFDVGDGVNSWIRSILILPNDQILISGWFNHYHNHDHYRMARINLDGSADDSFDPWFGDPAAIYSMALQGEKYIVSGHSLDTNGVFHQEIGRVLQNGTNDLSFNPGGSGANEKVESVAVQPDNKILMAGYFSMYDDQLVRNFARLNADGSLDTTLHAGANNWIWTVLLQRNNKILICGGFSEVNGVSRNGIARINPSDDYVEPAPPPNDPTNTFQVWLLNGTDVAEKVSLPDRPETSNSIWAIKAVGDINTNGHPDLIFQNATNGQIAAWNLDSTNFVSFDVLKKKIRDWQVIGVGDLTGDGESDILMRRPKDGRLAVMKFKKKKFGGASLLPKKFSTRKKRGVPRVTTSLLIPANWHFVGFNDFNGDGKNDLLWQDEQNRLVVWFMNDRKFVSSSYLDSDQPLVDWRAVAMGDIDGDLQKDVLFQHGDGTAAAWFLNGTNVVNSAELFGSGQVDARWKLIGVGDMNGDGQTDVIWKFDK